MDILVAFGYCDSCCWEQGCINFCLKSPFSVLLNVCLEVELPDDAVTLDLILE